MVDDKLLKVLTKAQMFLYGLGEIRVKETVRSTEHGVPLLEETTPLLPDHLYQQSKEIISEIQEQLERLGNIKPREGKQPIDIEWYKVEGASTRGMISTHAMLIYEDGSREIACGYALPGVSAGRNMIETGPPTGSTICGRCHVKLGNNQFYGIIRQCEACGYIGKPLVRRPDSDYEQFCPECGAVNSFPAPSNKPSKSTVVTPLFLASMPIPKKQGRTPWLPKK